MTYVSDESGNWESLRVDRFSLMRMGLQPRPKHYLHVGNGREQERKLFDRGQSKSKRLVRVE